jgi:hypothetical protein
MAKMQEDPEIYQEPQVMVDEWTRQSGKSLLRSAGVSWGPEDVFWVSISKLTCMGLCTPQR